MAAITSRATVLRMEDVTCKVRVNLMCKHDLVQFSKPDTEEVQK